MRKLLASLIASQVVATVTPSTVVFYPNGSFASTVTTYPGLDTVLLEETPAAGTSTPATQSQTLAGLIVAGAIIVSLDNTNMTLSLDTVKEIQQIGRDFYRSRPGDIGDEVKSGKPIFPPMTFKGIRVSQYLINPRPRSGNTQWKELAANFHVVLRRYRPTLLESVRVTKGGEFFTTTRKIDPEGESVDEIISLVTVHWVSQQGPDSVSTPDPLLAIH